MPNLIFKNAEEAKETIMDSQKKEIAALYEKWADEIGEKAKHFSHQSTASSVVSERQMKELQKMLKATGQEVSNEVYSKVKKNMYTIADAVVADNVKWLQSFGFSTDGLNAAFNYVPDEIVRNLITGQIYSSGWSLSKRIWGDNEQTMKDAYQIMAKGLAENKSVYDIAKELEQYVRPNAKKPWNPVLAMKNTKTGKIEYKRIYKKQVDYNAQRLARTLAQHSYQQSFLATTQNNPFITEYIWRSNGSRVCDLCNARDGVHFKKDELPMDHPNGMCVMEPVVVKDMVDQLADWFNSPDGTYPEIDAFAGNFGYEAKVVGTAKDFIDKYGMSTKSPNAWYNSLTQIQKAEAKALKDQSGLTWNEWYEKNIKSTGDPNLDFTKKWGASDKAPSSWFNSLSTQQKAEAKALKESSGLTWNQWYEKYVYKGGSAPAVSATTAKTKTVKAFNEVQEKYLAKYGFSPSKMPKEFNEWSHLVSYDDAAEILKSMGTSWSDPHPYQQLMKYYNANLTDKSFVSKAAKAAATKVDDVAAATATKKVASKVDDAVTVVFNESQWNDMIRSQRDRSYLTKLRNWENDWEAQLNSTQKHAVHLYTKEGSNCYIQQNGYLRFGQSVSDDVKRTVNHIKAALDKSVTTEDMMLVRGTKTSLYTDIFKGDLKVALDTGNVAAMTGQVFRDPGFLSTSPNGDEFGGNLQFKIFAPAGTKGGYVEQNNYFGEKEFLLQSNTAYYIEKAEKDAYGNIIMYLRILV